ncbi:TPA: hypothetical protein SMG11_002151 [Serratia marcescens]|nr:hypothetical protein [Serratia marcescens]MBH2692653.1 hypothetical protein [Serratia marcescens]MBH2831089.1 hypothetical protein [Serratia marcescens]MBH3224479.1 hypothetical protein [Serratia marcescens]HEJ7260151.1 hypothetical protein [Serratia marcescens]
MDNKLSELSKPVGFVSKQAQVLLKSGDTASVRPFFDVQGSSPLYSQEYVSALLEDNERVARDLVARNGEIEWLRKRAAELESIRADASQVFKEIGNELGCNPDNESIMMAIDALKERENRVVALAGGNAELWETMAARLEEAEKRLATPVRLPDVRQSSSGDRYQWSDGAHNYRLDVISMLLGAGFTVAVEGDE